MQWISARVVFEHPEPAIAAEWIADVFHGMGLSGVVMEVPGQEEDVDWAGGAPPPLEAFSVTGYFPADETQGASRETLARALEGLSRSHGIRWHVLYAPVQDEDWAESWKEHYYPEKVANRTVICPSWRTYRASPGDLVIRIDPGMAFGTGTHPTTRLCIQLLETFVEPGSRFLDLGTGSGILMCVAAGLGAGWMLGVDIDPVAVTVAAENLRKNQVSPDRFALRVEDLISGVEERFDVAAANILTPVILPLLERIDRVLVPGGVFVCSGILAENSPLVAEKMAEQGMEVIETRKWDDWAALAGRKRR